MTDTRTAATLLSRILGALALASEDALRALVQRTLAVHGAVHPDPAGTFRPLADTGVRVGDVLLAWGHSRWRAVVAWEVTRTRVRFVYVTPSGLNPWVTGTTKIADAYSLVSLHRVIEPGACVRCLAGDDECRSAGSPWCCPECSHGDVTDPVVIEQAAAPAAQEAPAPSACSGRPVLAPAPVLDEGALFAPDGALS